MIRAFLAAALLALLSVPASAQSTPNWTQGYVPTAGQWNAEWASKQDTLGYVPLNRAGGFMLGPLATFASATGAAGFNLPPGVAPTSPVNGDIWETSAGIYAQINGATVGPLVAIPTPVTVPNGGTGQITLANHGVLLGAGTGAIGTATVGTAGRLLIDQGGSTNPAFVAVSQDCGITSAGVMTCLKTNNVPFSASATTDTTNASNISSGTLAIARGGTGQGTAAAARTPSGLNIDEATSHGDSAYTILSTDRTVLTSAALTAPRVWTLPAASSVNAGQSIDIRDAAGGVTGTNTLTVTAAGSDTINGSATAAITSAYGGFALKSDGVSKWTFVATSGTGTVTSVTCNGGLTGGTFTTSGTCALSTPVSTANGGTGAANLNGIVQAATTNTITAGYTLTPFSIGTVSSGTTTLAGANGNYQYLTNNGAFTLAAPAADTAIDLLITNGASAGAITFSGFTVGSNTGDPLTTTNTNKFLVSIVRINGVSTYSVRALQ